MGKVLEYTLVGTKATFEGKLGCAVLIDNTVVHNTPKAKIATAEGEIDGIITDLTLTGADELTLAVAKKGDIVFAKLDETGVTVGDALEVKEGGVLGTKDGGVEVAKALKTGVANELIPVLIK